MKSKEEELNATISELETNVSSLNASLATEVSEKLREKEARMALEKNQGFLREELKRSEQNALNANEKVKTQADMYKRLQEYITRLQQYNAKLQNELKAATSAKKQVEKESCDIGKPQHQGFIITYCIRSLIQLKFLEILRRNLQQVKDDREWL